MTKKRFLPVTLAVLFFVPFFVLAQAGYAQSMQGSMSQSKAASETDLQLALRSLWVDHIFWVRNVVLMTKLGDAGAAQVAEEQAVNNAKQIADSIAPYYGKAASDKLLALLATHYQDIKSYMLAEFSSDSAGATKAMQEAYANADQIASFLSSANPTWPRQTLDDALRAHVAQHIAQIIDINTRHYAAGAQVWEAEKNHMYAIADTLAMGIAKQFALATPGEKLASRE